MARRRESSGRGSAANPQGGSFGERPIRAGEGSRRRDAARFGGFRPSSTPLVLVVCLLLALPAAGCGADGDGADGRPLELAAPRAERDGAREVFVVGDSLADRGVTLNAINPGPVDTGWPSEELRERLASRFPAGHWGRPDDIAAVVAWLASPQSGWITGQVIDAEGGFRRAT